MKEKLRWTVPCAWTEKPLVIVTLKWIQTICATVTLDLTENPCVTLTLEWSKTTCPVVTCEWTEKRCITISLEFAEKPCVTVTTYLWKEYEVFPDSDCVEQDIVLRTQTQTASHIINVCSNIVTINNSCATGWRDESCRDANNKILNASHGKTGSLRDLQCLWCQQPIFLDQSIGDVVSIAPVAFACLETYVTHLQLDHGLLS